MEKIFDTNQNIIENNINLPNIVLEILEMNEKSNII